MTQIIQRVVSHRFFGIALTLSALGYMLLAFAIRPAVDRVIALPQGDETYTSWSPEPYTGTRVDVDTYLIHYGVADNPNFSSTLVWWYGSWGPGEIQIPGHPAGARVAFYRPVSSLSFWGMWKWFGMSESRYILFNYVCAILSGILFPLASFALFRYINLKPIGVAVVLATLGFWTGFGEFVNPAAGGASRAVYGVWKNLPDALAGIFMMLTILAYFAGMGKRHWLMRNLWIAPLFLACGSKEVVTLLPLALVTLEFPILLSQERKAEHMGAWKRVATLMIYFAAFHVFRLAVLNGVGYRYGSNDVWLIRFVNSMFYPWGVLAVADNLMPLFVFCGITAPAMFLVWRAYRRRPIRMIHIAYYLTAFSASATLNALVTNFDSPEAGLSERLAYGMVHLVTYGLSRWEMIIGMAATLLALYLLIKRKELRFLFLFCTAWAVLSGIPNIFSPSPIHREYVPGFAWAWLYGAGFALLLHALTQRWGFLPRPVLFQARRLSAQVE